MNAEIISVDSMQVYRRMDIGTAKPSAEVRGSIAHHMIDVVDPADEFTARRFRDLGRKALHGIAEREHTAIIVGGSGLHFRALVDHMTFAPSDEVLRRDLEAADPSDLAAELLAADPRAGDVVDLRNQRRVLRAIEILRLSNTTPSERFASAEAEGLRRYRSEIPFVAIGFDAGDGIGVRIEERFDRMLASGLLDEVAHLQPSLGRTAREAVGYRELLAVVAGEASLEEARIDALTATRALAKRQRTWFRRDPRVRWLPWHHDPDVRIERAWDALTEDRAWSS